jgi:hypothetical protein
MIKKSRVYEIVADNLIKYSITPNQLVLLNIIAEGDEAEYMNYVDIENREEIVKHDIYTLWKKSYIENDNSDKNRLVFKFQELHITELGNSILTNKPLKATKYNSDFDSFVDEYYALWPNKVVTGNTLVKSGLSTCKQKLFTFIKETKYDRETILKATQTYINVCKSNGWGYMKTAYNFIKKDSESVLKDYCEQVSNTDISTPETSTFKEI